MWLSLEPAYIFLVLKKKRKILHYIIICFYVVVLPIWKMLLFKNNHISLEYF